MAQTPAAPQGLPPAANICGVCRGENPPGMKFCRSCGSALAQTNAAMPAGMPPAGPMGMAPPPAGGAMGMMGGAMAPTMAPPMPPPMAPPMMAPAPMGAPPPMMSGGMPPPAPMPPPGVIGGLPPGGPPPSTIPGPAAPRPVGAGTQTVACPRCATQTPVGFAYCQQCGLHMQALQPTNPDTARPRTPSSLGAPPLANTPIDPQGATLAPASAPPAIARAAPPIASPIPQPTSQPAPSGAPSWGSAVLVNRDGSDGQRYPLTGESLMIGRAGADIAFDDDRFLARHHARLDHGAGGVKITALDQLNGVFKKASEQVDLVHGSVVLVGREVLQFELLEPEEKSIHPMVRHGVAVFGSPPREPWGRFLQLIPSGGHRDVRHLCGDEVVLGREDGDLVYRDDAFMSRRHAAVTWNGQAAKITDLGSSNGTFVKVSTVALKSGDHVRMGDQLLRIEIGR